MIYFKKNAKDIKIYLHECTWFLWKPWIIFCIVCIVPILYFTIVGIVVDRHMLSYAVGISLFCLIIIIMMLRVRSVYKKMLLEFFESANPDGSVDMSISVDGGEYVIENLTKKTVIRIKKNKIQMMRLLKNCIFIRMSLGEVLFFPKTDELVALFSKKPSNNVENKS